MILRRLFALARIWPLKEAIHGMGEKAGWNCEKTERASRYERNSNGCGRRCSYRFDQQSEQELKDEQ